MTARALAAAALAAALFPAAAPAIDFTSFHTPAQMDAELNALAAAHPGLAQVFTIGTTAEGRPIRGLKISDNVATDEPGEGDVVFVGLHHAREWISAELALYLAEYLVTHHGTDPALAACMNQLEVWIIPVMNPDGYAYSAAAPANRLWRKNRRNNGDGTFGVDLNRNYSYQWGLGSGSEGSNFTWEDTYRGPSAFSEPETQALRDFVQGLHNPRSFVTYHSYSELFLRPWAHTTADPPGEPSLALVAQDSIARIAAVHGHTYTENIWYVSYGEATDFFWNESRVAGFTPELRPASAGGGGFVPPPGEIIPTSEENLAAALALIRDAGCRKVWIKDHAADTGVEPSAVWLGDHWSQAFWVSPDIWTDPVALEEGSTVTLFARVHNDSGAALTGATVRAYFTDPRVSLEFPSPVSTLIGQQTLTLPPGDSTVSFSWTVPVGTNSWGERHWCVGVVVSHADDRPLTTQIQRTNNVGGRNFNTVEVAAAQTLFVAVTNFLDVAAEYRVDVDRRQLPSGWRVVVPRVPAPCKPSRKARLLRARGEILEPGQTVFQPIRVDIPPGSKPGSTFDLDVSGMLLPLVAGKRVPMGNGYTFRIRTGPPPSLDAR